MSSASRAIWLRQVWRKDHVAVYERSLSPEHPPRELELVIIRVRGERVRPNREVVAATQAILAPRSYGWSFPVSMKPFVMDLAEKSLGIRKGFGSFVREATTDFKCNPVPQLANNSWMN